jgi:hypothetical protein
MEQRISLVTLGVADLPRAVAFYDCVLGLVRRIRSGNIWRQGLDELT